MSDECRILYKSGGLLAIDKPAGLAVHSAPGPGSSVLKKLIEQTGLLELTPVHRLDKDATGVLLFGESKALAADVQREWESAEKTYLALCDGKPERASGVIDAPILENQTGKPERLRNAVRYFEKTNPGVAVPPLPVPKTSAVHPAGRPSQTHYEVLKTLTRSSLLSVRPRQGRMHQIRVHLAHVGHPLLVDPLYGKRETLLKRDWGQGGDEVLLARVPLHACTLVFSFKGSAIKIEAEIPDDFRKVMAASAQIGDDTKPESTPGWQAT